jgi:hypothetical protein
MFQCLVRQATRKTLSPNRSKIPQNVMHLVILHFYIMRRQEGSFKVNFHFDLTNDVYGNNENPLKHNLRLKKLIN